MLTKLKLEDGEFSLVFVQFEFIVGDPKVNINETPFNPKFSCQHILRIFIREGSINLRVISMQMVLHAVVTKVVTQCMVKCRVGTVEGPGNFGELHSSSDGWIEELTPSTCTS